jgi:hypothetical protein
MIWPTAGKPRMSPGIGDNNTINILGGISNMVMKLKDADVVNKVNMSSHIRISPKTLLPLSQCMTKRGGVNESKTITTNFPRRKKSNVHGLEPRSFTIHDAHRRRKAEDYM